MIIKRAILETGKLNELYLFYKNVLRLHVEKEKETLTIRFINSSLTFHSAKSGQNPYYHFAFQVPYNFVDQARIWLQQRVKLLWLEEYKSYIAEFINWQARSVYFIDPAGNIVELIGRAMYDNKNAEVFSSSQISDINEVGLVFPVDTYEQEVLALMKQNTLSYYKRQPALKHFCALGSDDGLLICVPANRNWYPTVDRASRIFPVEIDLENDGEIISLKYP